MVAIDRDRDSVRALNPLGESLVTTAGIYGPNASGKSNVVIALSWLRDAMLSSLYWDVHTHREQFAFTDWPDRPSEFVLDWAVNGVRFEYEMELDNDGVRYEALFHYPERKRRRVFERDGLDIKFQRGLPGLTGTKELLREGTLAISVMRRFKIEPVDTLVSDLLRVQRRILGGTQHMWAQVADVPIGMGVLHPELAVLETIRLFAGPWAGLDADKNGRSRNLDRLRASAVEMLRHADMGIASVDVPEGLGQLTQTEKYERVKLVHDLPSGGQSLPFLDESRGTRAWFELVVPVLEALKFGSLLIVDELDSSLHPTLSAQLLDLFHSREANPRGAQLLFTSHDTSLLNHLNRDEVWFTQKQQDGSTRLGPLSDFAGERVRKSVNLESGYLNGRFGALPDVGEIGFLRALGLVG